MRCGFLYSQACKARGEHCSHFAAIICCTFAFILSPLACAASAEPQNWLPTPEQKPTYSVVYTGRLFGYYRYPDIQTSSQSGCPSQQEVPLPTQVTQFRSALQRLRRSDQVLVSMGDNFAPELLSRTIRNDLPGTAHQGEMVSKNLFDPTPQATGWRQRAPSGQLGSVEGVVPFDNVGCFFRLMQFDAVVPGFNDFYFGPARLLQIARFLAGPASGGERPTQLLAANLLIRPLGAGARFSLTAAQLPAILRQVLAPNDAIHFDLPSDVMPWVKQVAIHSQLEQVRVFDCLLDLGKLDAFMLPLQLNTACAALREATSGSGIYRFQAPTAPSGNFISSYYSLDPGDNHALCAVYGQTSHESTHCELFHVQYPLLQYRPKASGTTPVPYYVQADGNGPAVFGVLDPDLAKRTTEFNNSSDTEVAIGDPAEALRQLLQLCESDVNCKDRHKVLLAQMPSYKAAQLAASLKSFDMVVAEADAEHASGDEYVGRSGSTSSYLLAPGAVYQGGRANVLSTNLRRVDFYSGPSDHTAPIRFFANQVEDVAVSFPKHGDCLTCNLNIQAGRSAKIAGSDPQEVYAKLALESMQQFCHSDIALLPRRDVFSGFEETVQLWPAGFKYTAQQLIEEVLWKGDFTLCAPVEGSALSKVLTESAAFDRQDQDLFSIEAEHGRGLRTLGIQKDAATGGPLIRGVSIQNDAVYAVAMPSELGFGNAGYPEFPKAAMPPGVQLSALTPGESLSGLTCAKLPENVKRDSCQVGHFPKNDRANAVLQQPGVRSRGAPEWLLQWKNLFSWSGRPEIFASAGNKSSPDEQVARRGLWWISVQNISVGYSLTFLGGSDRTIPGSFSGNNTFSQLSTPEQSAFSFWERARGGYAFPRFLDFYVSAETKYAQAAIRSPDQLGNFGDYQRNIRDNLIRDEVGLLSKPIFQKVPVRLLVSENLSTQLVHPIQQIAASPPCPTGTNCQEGTTISTFALNKNYQVLTRFGARLQNSRNWLEAGREYGGNINTAYDYAINDVGFSEPFPCQIKTYYTLTSCVANDPYFSNSSKILPLTTTRHLSGWFLNFHSTLPLYRNKLLLSIDSYGEMFDKRQDDTTFDTRFYEDLTVALTVPIWGNLVFAPQVETFFYQNKIVNGLFQVNHYLLVSSSVKLEYSFDWHRGVGLTNALRSPTATPNSGSGKSR
jgi:hypothetical protein